MLFIKVKNVNYIILDVQKMTVLSSLEE